ncbi:alpha-amylase family glycosyl hydrolase [Reichenbachiella sp. MSK19-1]|uniref:alpha-amylase family glycosyl hydrolase n=1 Tax=Reichenbachiella sp. MSK19-1 TaxID=1897631 RepID=UPI000E6BDD52|nr:alpha-amylase family glycosyl hydrolase [Reichenbachiella sp. MSK19-1]
MKIRLLVFLMCMTTWCYGQFTTDPAIPIADQPMTLTVDVTGTPLADYTDDIWLWAWVENATADADAPTNVNPATDDQSDALMTRSDSDANEYTITLTPTTFFGKEASEIEEMGFLLKGRDWANGQTPDYAIEIVSNQFVVKITTPNTSTLLVDAGETVSVAASASAAATLTLKVDGVTETTVSSATELTYDLTALASGTHSVTVMADNGKDQSADEFTYTVRGVTVEQERPTGIVDGINYHAATDKVTLSVWAPLKSSVYVVGEFTDWQVDAAFLMKKDGEHFWLEVDGLTAGKAYGFQYLVDETIWIADPYADMILDPDDVWITDDSYSDLIDYPAGAMHDNWYENRVAVLETGQSEYVWTDSNFEQPDKEDLIIYELLVRDFLGEENMNYQALIDTLDYIQGLGVNTIELMPIMEFNGNDSWGYNPTFMFAVDKAYGTKNDLKEFIDEVHGRGMAVILDMVMNQNDIPSPYAQMYFDYDAFAPTDENPWFNRVPKHPYNVFADINHESSYTQTWLDSINHYWIKEFHFDGYRFDLSKGFTQVDSGDDVAKWGNKDDSRIAILKRMADQIWAHSPDAYVILEHFGDNDEETILADYGMMLWGNSHGDFKEANLGYASGKSVEWAYAGTRGWQDNHVVAYMESHDEERQMFDMLTYGSSDGNYSTRDLKSAADRLKMSATFFFNIPGPKMLWQWGEYGYDISIEENGRTGRKPAHWEYLEEANKASVYQTYKEVLALKDRYHVFADGDFTWQPDGELKTIHLSNADTSVVILTNYGLKSQSIAPEFQHTGTWYDFFTGEELEIDNLNIELIFDPGEYHIYTDHKLHTPDIDVVLGVASVGNEGMEVYPNPSSNQFKVDLGSSGWNQSAVNWSLIDILGRTALAGSGQVQDLSIPVQQIRSGVYTLRVSQGTHVLQRKVIVQ